VHLSNERHREEAEMSASAETIRFPGKGSGHRRQWYAVAAVLVVAAVVIATLMIVSSRNTATTSPDRVAPATHQQATDTSGAAVAPRTTVRQVGGTSIYRYHPLPGVNSAFELIEPPAIGGASHGTVDPRVGGSGDYQYHLLP